MFSLKYALEALCQLWALQTSNIVLDVPRSGRSFFAPRNRQQCAFSEPKWHKPPFLCRQQSGPALALLAKFAMPGAFAPPQKQWREEQGAFRKTVARIVRKSQEAL